MLKKAYEGGYAVGGFSINNMEMIQGVIAAGKKTNSPMILQVSQGARKYADLTYLQNMASAITHLKNIASAIAGDCGLPIALHLDHGDSFEVCKECVDCGFTSVMIDGSHLPLEENIALTKRVADYAHDNGVAVEGELNGREHAQFTCPEEVGEFVFKTNVDSLAIAIGNCHGAFKPGEAHGLFKADEHPSLRFDILSDIEKLLPGTPLVLHGVSSVPQQLVSTIEMYGGSLQGAQGVPEEMLRKAASMSAVCKINMDSDLRLAYTAAIRKYLTEHPSHFDPRQYLAFARSAVEEMVEHKIVKILGSNNKATED